MANIPAEDLLTLANEAASPEDRRALLRQCGETLLALGRFAPAETIFRDLRAEFTAAGSDEKARFESQLALIRKMRSDAPQLTARFDQVVIGSGHMIDAPDRQTPRFPAAKAELVRAEIARPLAEWGVGADDLVICGGACGADLLIAEEGLKRGAQLRLLLSQEVDEFVRDSVQNGGAEWVPRFQMLRQHAEVATQLPRLGQAPEGTSIYARTNLWMINSARVEASTSAKIHALLVWDEKPTGDGPGGTSDFESRVRALGGRISIINPTTLP